MSAFWRRLDPRSSVASRLLLGFFLAFCIPGGAFVFLLERRLSELERFSARQLAAVRIGGVARRMAQDAHFRAQWIDRRAQTLEDAINGLADAARLALTSGSPVDWGSPAVGLDPRGRLWTTRPDRGTVAWLEEPRAGTSSTAAGDLHRTGALAPALAAIVKRNDGVLSVTLRTVSGVGRRAPWRDLGGPSPEPDGSPWPVAARVPADAATRWSDIRSYAGGRVVTLSAPVRDGSGALAGELSFVVDASRMVADALEQGEIPGDIWLLTNSVGQPLITPPRGRAAGSADPWTEVQRRQVSQLLRKPSGSPTDREGSNRLAAARVATTGWVFVEGLSAAALARLESAARLASEPQNYARLRRDVLLLFGYLVAAVLGAVLLVSRRITEPVHELLRAAEAIGDGRAVHVKGTKAPDELGRLAAALDRMGRRVARRVETLRRLHHLSRAGF
ncbi:MAG TPA: cache and HAMP domain-containing protein, partial [Thermoanaerobaculia bacterium]|nr:cache and HAMP domain-containing protein [Thermoanaerobaculia bacterium]